MPELPTQEQFIRNKRGHFRRMNLVTRYCAFFLGILLVATGCCFPELYHWGMGCASTPKAATLIHRLAIGGLPVILIFLLAVCDGIRILLLGFQRCPHCHRWYFFWRCELVAGNQCPYCRNRLYIPGKIGEQPYEKPSCEGIVYIYFVLATFLLSALACISIIMNTSESGLLYTQLTWIGVGTAWIILFPVSVRLYNKFICQQREKDRRKNVCPHCHEYYDPLILRMSGNCSSCGSLLDSEWPPPEPDPLADLPTLREVCVAKQSKTVSLVSLLLFGYFLFSIIQLCLPEEHVLQAIPSFFPWGIAVFIIFLAIHFFRFRRIAKVFLRCPYCHFGPFRILKEPPDWNTAGRDCHSSYFLRCPNCRRKLVRDENEEGYP